MNSYRWLRVARVLLVFGSVAADLARWLAARADGCLDRSDLLNPEAPPAERMAAAHKLYGKRGPDVLAGLDRR